MNLKRVNGMHTIKCDVCGAERLSPKPPNGKYTPKACRACNQERQRETLRRIFGQPPKRPV